MRVGKFMSKCVMVDCRYLSLALKHNLAVSISLEQTCDISLLNCQRQGDKHKAEKKKHIKKYISQSNSKHSRERESIAEQPRFVRFMRKEANIFACST